MRWIQAVTAVFGCAVLGQAASAALVADQQGATFVSGSWNAPVVQSFRPGASHIAAVDVFIGGTSALTTDVTVSLYTGWDGTNHLLSGLLRSASDANVDRSTTASVSWLPVNVVPEQTYYLKFDTSNGLTIGGNRSNEYDRGQVLMGGGNTSGGDVKFTTYFDDTVPEPASAAMLAAGAALLLARRRRQLI